jgi:uncharacterized membrane protein
VASRRTYIDWLRGLAVLIMIEAHTLDAWTRGASRTGPVFRNLTILGGFAAPAFLWLAGLALVLSAARALERTGSRSRATDLIVRRGLEIFILAFAFRVQAFIVSPGSWLVTIFRVDILNVMGPSIALAGVIWGLARGARRAALWNGAVAAAIALLTPIVRAAGWVDALPLWVQWYVRPFGDHTTFTLFPWAGFVFAGAAAGALLSMVLVSEQAETRLMSALTVSGGFLVALGFYTATLPPLYKSTWFWTTSPTFFAIRIGVLMLTLGVAYALSRVAGRGHSVSQFLQIFGRNSLFIYWIHVELVYGYATWLIHGRLPLWGTAVGYVAFCALMYAAIRGRDRFEAWWRSRTAQKLLSQSAAA